MHRTALESYKWIVLDPTKKDSPPVAYCGAIREASPFQTDEFSEKFQTAFETPPLTIDYCQKASMY